MNDRHFVNTELTAIHDRVLNVDALYVALDRQRRHTHKRWRDVAGEAGVSPSTLSRIGQGHRPDADGLVRLLAWLGTADLAPYITTSKEIPR